MTSTIFFSNSRSLERPGLIIETLEYLVKVTKKIKEDNLKDIFWLNHIYEFINLKNS